MADANTLTGSRDDLVVDISRCLKMRFSESDCHRCIDICPQGAVTLDGGLILNSEQCRGCLLCTSVCLVGALEQNSDFDVLLSKLSKVSDPVLGCIRTNESSNATLACLGGLSEEHLVVLGNALTGKLTLNLTACKGCPNSSMLPYLYQRIEVLANAGLLEGGCRIVTAESVQDICYRDESVGRRSFFKSFRNSLFQSAAVMLSVNNEAIERQTEYAGKRVPVRQELLNSVRNTYSRELAEQIRQHFDAQVTFGEVCTKCQGCVAICPTGALKTETEDETPIFDRLQCTGCGLCREFCLDGAVRVIPISFQSDLFVGSSSAHQHTGCIPS